MKQEKRVKVNYLEMQTALVLALQKNEIEEEETMNILNSFMDLIEQLEEK